MVESKPVFNKEFFYKTNIYIYLTTFIDWIAVLKHCWTKCIDVKNFLNDPCIYPLWLGEVLFNAPMFFFFLQKIILSSFWCQKHKKKIKRQIEFEICFSFNSSLLVFFFSINEHSNLHFFFRILYIFNTYVIIEQRL